MNKKFIFDLDLTLYSERDYIDTENESKYYNSFKTKNFLRKLLLKLPYKKYIFTNANLEHAKVVLDKINLKNIFVNIMSSDLAGDQYKPNLPIYHEVIKDFKIKEDDEIYFFEDQEINLKTAKEKFNWNTVLISPDKYVKKKYIDYKFNTIEEAILFFNVEYNFKKQNGGTSVHWQKSECIRQYGGKTEEPPKPTAEDGNSAFIRHVVEKKGPYVNITRPQQIKKLELFLENKQRLKKISKKIINYVRFHLQRLQKGGRKRYYVLRVTTDKAAGFKFNKLADSMNNLKEIIRNANKILNNEGKVIFSMVYPDSHYKSKKETKYIHQAHTFAMGRDENTLIVYDNSGEYKYTGKESYLDNYKYVINTLKKGRNLIFFPIVEGIKKYDEILDKDQGGCIAYIDTLVDDKLIQKPPLDNILIKGDKDDTWLYNASNNKINKL